MNRILIVEDDASIRDSLIDFFTGRGWDVHSADNAAAAKAAWTPQSFHVVLLDLQLPDGDGLDLLRQARRRGDHTPTIALTARGALEQRVLGLQVGADDYLLKPFSVHELAARIDAVLRRSGAPALAQHIGDAEVDLAGHLIRRDDSEHRLLPKEADLLEYLLLHRGVAVSRDDLLRAVWGYDATPTTRTVDTHVFNLRKKLEADPGAPVHLLTVHGVGYRLV